MVLEDILTKTELENPRAQSERRNCAFAFQFRSSSLKRGFFMLTLYAGISLIFHQKIRLPLSERDIGERVRKSSDARTDL